MGSEDEDMGRAQRKPHATTAEPRWPASRVLLVLLGAAIVAWFVARVGVARIAEQLLRAGPRALLLLVPYAAGTAIGAVPWGLLLPEQIRPSTIALLESRFAASSANSLLPFFGVAGEPSRLLWLPEGSRPAGVAAIVIDRVLYNSANGFLLIVGTLTAYFYTPLPGSLLSGALAIALSTLGVTVLALWLVPRFGIGRRVQGLLRWLVGASYADRDFGSRVDAALLTIVRGPSRPLALGAAIHVVGRAVIAAEFWVGLRALDAPAGVVEALVLAVVPIALSFFFSSIPSQLGVQEGAQTFMATALGMDPALVLSLVLLQRFRQIAFAALLPALVAMARPARKLQRGAP